MKRRSAGWSSYVTASVLAAGVLFVFWVFQYYGPQSAVRRYQVLVSNISSYLPDEEQLSDGRAPGESWALVTARDLAELDRLTLEPLDDPSTVRLLDLVRPYAYARARYDIPRVDYPNPSKALAVTVYQVPGYRPNAMVYVVQREGTTWKINSSETLQVLRDLLGR
jgi:hypothetical protein